MGISIYIWNMATESEVADTIGSTATTYLCVHRPTLRYAYINVVPPLSYVSVLRSAATFWTSLSNAGQ